MANLGDQIGIVTYNPGNLRGKWDRDRQRLSTRLSAVIRLFASKGADVICIHDFAVHEVGISALREVFTPLAEDLDMNFHMDKCYIAFTKKCLRMTSSLELVYPGELAIAARGKRHWRTVQLLSSVDKQLGVVNVHCPVGHKNVKVLGTVHDHTCTPGIKTATFHRAACLASEGFRFSVVCGDFNCNNVCPHGGVQWIRTQLAGVPAWNRDRRFIINGLDGDFIVALGFPDADVMQLGIGKASGDSDCHESVGCLFTVPPLDVSPSSCEGNPMCSLDFGGLLACICRREHQTDPPTRNRISCFAMRAMLPSLSACLCWPSRVAGDTQSRC